MQVNFHRALSGLTSAEEAIANIERGDEKSFILIKNPGVLGVSND